MIVIITMGQAVMVFEGPAEGIAEVLKNHAMGQILAQGHTSFDIRVPVTGHTIKVTDTGEVDERQIAATPIVGS